MVIALSSIMCAFVVGVDVLFGGLLDVNNVGRN